MVLQKLKTLVLLAGLSALLLVLGNLLGGIIGLQLALIMALIMNGIAYFFSDKIVLRMYGAQPLDPHQYGWIHDYVADLAHAMNIPKPKLWLVKTPMANAFATGRSPHHASIAVTTGIISLLERYELRGVLAHELAHVKNRDILVTTIAATLATAIGYVAHMMQHAALWGSHEKRKHGNPFGMFIMALLMPLAATLIQLAVSRSREYLADETGARHCHDPLALAGALEKLHQSAAQSAGTADSMHRASTASLFIVHPFTTQGLMALFSTHPPMHARIERLRALHHKQRFS